MCQECIDIEAAAAAENAKADQEDIDAIIDRIRGAVANNPFGWADEARREISAFDQRKGKNNGRNS